VEKSAGQSALLLTGTANGDRTSTYNLKARQDSVHGPGFYPWSFANTMSNVSAVITPRLDGNAPAVELLAALPF